jgi:hypothetical protein
MNHSDSLLPLAEVTERLRVTRHGYVGVRSIPLDKIIGSVDRASEFDRDFHPQRRDSDARMRKLEVAFPNGDFPAISVFEVGGAYFVSDGHHRVALAHRRGQEFIEAEVVQLATNYRLSPDVDIPQLVHTELRRMVMEESGLQEVRPDLDISFSNPAGYLELLETIKAHGWDLARCLGRLPSPEELGTSWLTEVYQPGLTGAVRGGIELPTRGCHRGRQLLVALSAAPGPVDARLPGHLPRRRVRHSSRAEAVAAGASCTTARGGETGDGASSGAGQLLKPQRQRLRSIPSEGLRLTAWLPFPADGRRPYSNLTSLSLSSLPS